MARKPRKITGKKRKPMSLAHRKAISLALARELGPTPTYDPYEKKGRKPGKHKNTGGNSGGSKASANKRARAAQNRKNGPKTVESVAAKKLPKNHVSGGGRQADPDFLNKDAIRQEPGYADTLDMQREMVKASPEARAAFMNQVKNARKAAQIDHGPDPENGEYGRNRAAQRRALHLEAMAEDMGLIKAENTRRAQDQADAVNDRAEEAKKRNEKRREQGLRERKAAQERNKKQREEAERKQRDAQADKADKDGKRDKAAQADKADQPAEHKKQRAETKRKQREEQQRAENNAREATPEQREQQRRDAQREQRDKQEQALERAASERSAARRAQYANWDDDQLAEAHAAIMDKWGGDLDPANDDGYDFHALAERDRDRKTTADLLDEMDDRAAERAGYTDNRDYGTVEAELEKHYALQAGAAEQDYYNQIAGDREAETELRDHLAAASKKHTEREAEYKAQLDKLTAPEKGDTSDEAKAYRKLAKAHKEAGRLSKAAKNKHDELETHMRETYPDYDRPFYYTDHEELTELHDALAAVDDPDEDTARLVEQTRDELWFRDPSEIDGWASESIREMKNRVRKYGHDLTEGEVIDRMAMAGNDRERVMNESGAFQEAYNDWLHGILAEYAREWTHDGIADGDAVTFLSNLMYNSKNDGKNITAEKMLSNAMYARRASGEARRLFASLGYLPSRKNFMRTIRGETPPEYSEGRLREITTRGGKSDRRSRAKILMDQEISEAADAKNLRGRARAQFIKEEKQRRNAQQLKNLREQDEQRRADKAKAEAENATANATDTTAADKRTVTTDDGREIDMDTIPGAATENSKGMSDRVKAILEKQAAQRAESDTPESTAEKTARENGTTPKVENVAKAVAKAEADKPAKRGRPKLDGPTLGEQRAEATREQTDRIDELKANRPATGDPARAQWDYDMADARLQHAQAVERFERDRMAKLAAQNKPLTSVKKNIDKAQDAQTKAREARDNALTKARDKYGDDAAETIRTTGGYVAPAKKKRKSAAGKRKAQATRGNDTAEQAKPSKSDADAIAIHHDTIDEYVGGQPNPSAVKAIRDHAKELTVNDLRRAYAEASETAENNQGDKFANIPADTYRQELQKRRLYNPKTGEVRDTPAPWGENEKGATEKVLSNPKARTGTMGKMLDRHEREYADALEKEGMAPAKAKAKAARERADYEKKLAAANNTDTAPAEKPAERDQDDARKRAQAQKDYKRKLNNLAARLRRKAGGTWRVGYTMVEGDRGSVGHDETRGYYASPHTGGGTKNFDTLDEAVEYLNSIPTIEDRLAAARAERERKSIEKMRNRGTLLDTDNNADTAPAAKAAPENKVDVKPEDYQGKDTLLVWDGSFVRKFDATNWNGKPTTTPLDRNPEAARSTLEDMAKDYPNSAVIMAHEKNTFGLSPEHRKEADEYNESVRQLLKDVQKATEKRAAEVNEERRQKKFDNARKAYEEAGKRRAEAVERSRSIPPVNTSDLNLDTPLGQAERDYREAERAVAHAEAMRDAIIAKGDEDTHQAYMAAADRGNNTPESRRYHRDRVQETIKEAQDAEVRADQRVKDAYAARDEARRVRDNAQRDAESMSDMSGNNGLQAATPETPATPERTTTPKPETADVDGADEINGRLWEKNGRSRTYINGWETAAGFEINRYKTGNVRSAYFNGRKLSNNRANQAVAGRRVYVDNNTGELHVDGLDNLTIDGETYDVFDQIAAAIKASGEVGDMELKRPGTTAPAAAPTTGETRDRTDNVVTFRRINGDEWGVTGTGLQVGDVVTARNRKGREKPVTITEIVTDTDGKQVARFEDNKGRKRARKRDAEQTGSNTETPARTAQAQPATPPTLPEGHDPYTGKPDDRLRRAETPEELAKVKEYDDHMENRPDPTRVPWVDRKEWVDKYKELKRELEAMGVDPLRNERTDTTDAAREAYKPTAAEKRQDSRGLYFNALGAWQTTAYHPKRTELPVNEDEQLFTFGKQEVLVPAGGITVQKNGKRVINGTDVKTGKPVKFKSDEFGQFDKPLVIRERPGHDFGQYDKRRTPQNMHAAQDMEERYPLSDKWNPNTYDDADTMNKIKRTIAEEAINADPFMDKAPTVTDEQARAWALEKIKGNELKAHHNRQNQGAPARVHDSLSDGEYKNMAIPHNTSADSVRGPGGMYYTGERTVPRVYRGLSNPGEGLAKLKAALVDDPDVWLEVHARGEGAKFVRPSKVEEFKYGYRVTAVDEDGKAHHVKIDPEDFNGTRKVWRPLRHDNGEPYTRDEAAEYSSLKYEQDILPDVAQTNWPEGRIWQQKRDPELDAALDELRKRGGELNFDDADEVDGLPDEPAPAPQGKRHKKGTPFTTENLKDGETLDERGNIVRGDFKIIATDDGYRYMETGGTARMSKNFTSKSLDKMRKDVDALTAKAALNGQHGLA